jgi:hypothetical protein
MTQIRLKRYYNPDATVGELIVMKGGEVLVLRTLELLYKENLKNISCIPQGDYKLKFNDNKNSKFYNNSYIVEGVRDRTDILIHCGNTLSDTKGCILIGCGYDGKYCPQVTQSGKAMGDLIRFIGDDKDINLTINADGDF